MDNHDGYNEKSSLLNTHPPVISAYSPGVVGAPSTIIEPPNQYKSRWRSIRVMYLTMFLSSVSFSICMSSVWPYLQLLDPSATTSFLGWVVASYSVGQLIASPLFGTWANIRARSREPLMVSLVINILANVLYAYLEVIPSGKTSSLIIARAFIGFGAGNVAVVRSYVSGATTTKERTVAMANMSAFQAVGFIFGPALQTAMVPIGYPGPLHTSEIHIDLYTTPAWMSAIVGVLNMVLLICVFSEHKVQNDEDINYSVQNDDILPDYTPDRVAVYSSLIIFFFILFIFAVFETILTPLTMHMLSWTKEQATLYTGICLACGGVVSIGVFMAIKALSKRVNERYLLVGGFIFCLAGFIIYLPWGHHYPDYQIATLKPATNITNLNSTGFPVSTYNNSVTPDFEHSTNSFFKQIDTQKEFDLPFLTNGNNSSKDVEPVGCPDSYKWCAYTPRIPLAQFLMGCLMICIGYPVCNVMSYTLFSKILGPKPQGIMMGLLTASGSFARTLGPVFVSQIYDAFGPRVTFLTMASVVLCTLIGVIVVFRRLVPFKFRNHV